ncbi:hypothetical protein ACH4T9_12520 [Micromonospora sp. NPDC020750]|uniref:hypothetical protein n=1 Tax=unclassified Micromonospora TaxID=2617518 RepID=UPI00379064C8
MTILDRIDNALDGCCPCGAQPRTGSPYCSPDCEPTHLAADTDTRTTGHYATPMRWRPDLVTAADDPDLIPVNATRTGYTGRHNTSVFERASDPTVWHLRLDNGHRYVGCDLHGMGTPDGIISIEQTARIHDTWQRLERELGNTRHLEPGRIPADFTSAIDALDRWVSEQIAVSVPSAPLIWRPVTVAQDAAMQRILAATSLSVDPQRIFRDLNLT